MPDGSFRAYAAHRKGKGLPGGSLQAVQKAVLTGRIDRAVASENGRLVIADFDLADREWTANTDYTKASFDTLKKLDRPMGVQDVALEQLSVLVDHGKVILVISPDKTFDDASIALPMERATARLLAQILTVKALQPLHASDLVEGPRQPGENDENAGSASGAAEASAATQVEDTRPR